MTPELGRLRRCQVAVVVGLCGAGHLDHWMDGHGRWLVSGRQFYVGLP
ncbi:hypothetical protein MCEMIE4_03229 [Sphingobium cupriresistens]|jgi:hypothetical protein